MRSPEMMGQTRLLVRCGERAGRAVIIAILSTIVASRCANSLAHWTTRVQSGEWNKTGAERCRPPRLRVRFSVKRVKDERAGQSDEFPIV